MKFAKKIGAAFVAVVLALGVVSACSSGGSEPSDRDEPIVLWMFPTIADNKENRHFWTKVQDDFNAAHKDVDLKVELFPWENRDTKIATALASGTGPDLVLLGADETRNFFETGGLKPVDAVIEDERKSYLPGPLKAVTFDGKLYGVPIYQESYSTVYNKTLFEKAGITKMPETWEEVREAAPKLAKTGVAVMDYAGAPEVTLNVTFYPLLWQAGGSVFTKGGKDVDFDNSAGMDTLQFLVELKNLGGLPPGAATNDSGVDDLPLGTGKAAMSANANATTVQQMKAALPNDEIVVGLPLKDEIRAASGTPGVLALTTSNKNEKAAYAVARYIASPKIAHALNVAAGTYPVRTDTPAPGDDEVTKKFMDALEYVRPGPIVPNARQMMSILAPHIQAALLGKENPKQALNAAAAEGRDLIASSK